MEPSAKDTFLVDKRINPPVIVPAVLTRDITIDALDHIERLWRSARLSLNAREVMHRHWNWRQKRTAVRSGESRVVAVSCRGAVQGAMAIKTQPWNSHMEPSGCHLLYISYIEAAPWNLPGVPGGPLITNVGYALAAAAIRISTEQGWEGRIALHSLPTADNFYRNKLRMTELPDPYQLDMNYFEYNATDAEAFLQRTGL